uniref:Dynein heavy chain tail domain-containing protein n=1 Tax=Myripristis murdjan TaxID=586833 RepID=A0A667XMW0_9TELE
MRGDPEGSTSLTQPLANDKRLDVIRDFTLKSFRLNPDKWQAFILENCNRAIIGRFFDTPDLSSLFVQVDAASELRVALGLSQDLGGKAICFAKGALLVAGCRLLVVSCWLQVVCRLLRSMCPAEVAEDMYEHIDQLQNKVLEVKGQVQEQTFLPPPGSSAVLEDAAGRKWLHTLESVVIMWAEQVCELLQQDWAQDVQDRHKLLPQDEFDFWKKRLLNLQGVHTQVRLTCWTCRVSTHRYGSPAGPAVCPHTEDIVLHMEPLQKILQDIEHMDYTVLQVRGSMVALLDAVSELWSRSQFYCRPRRMVTLLQELCNNFISMVCLLHAHPSISPFKINIKQYNSVFRCVCVLYGEMFDLDSRLPRQQEVYCVCVELYQLEGVELPGSGGGAMTNTLLSVYDEFLQSVKVLAESKCDATSPQDQVTVSTELLAVMSHVTKLRLFQVLQMFGFLLARPLVQEQLRPALGRLVQMLSGELDRAQLLLQDATGSAGKNTPPAAGRLHRAHQLRQRVELTMKNFRAIQHLYVHTEHTHTHTHTHTDTHTHTHTHTHL